MELTYFPQLLLLLPFAEGGSNLPPEIRSNRATMPAI